MDEPDADMKAEAGVEGEGGVRYQDPLLVPTAVLLARREVASRYPQATVNQLHRVTEETLVYREYAQTSCQLPGAPKSTFLMVFSPDGSKVASTHGDHNIYVSEVKTGQCICTLEGHPRTPWCIAFHPASNEIIASGCLGGEVRVWDLKGGSEVWTTEKDTVIASLAFHPTDQVLVIATFNEIYFWDWFQPEPFATISTGDEKEKVRYVKFDPLGHKLITGIANTCSDRSPQGTSRMSGTNASPPLTRLELVAREIRLSHRYNQLSSRFRDLMSRYEALTSTALNNNSQTTSRVDRGTDPIEPPPATLGQQVLLNQARQFAQQVTEEQRASSRDQDTTQGDGTSRGSSTWPSTDAQSNRESQTTGDSNLRLEEDYGLSAVRTLRQIISDDSASSSSLDSSSSATSGASGVSERNTRLSLLWTSRLQRPGIDSDSAGEASSVHSSGDTNAGGGAEARPSQSGERDASTATRPGESVGGTEFRQFRGSDGQGSDDDEGLGNLDLPSASAPDRSGTLWGYYSSRGVIHTGRNRANQERLSSNNVVYNDDNNNTTGSSFLPLFVNSSQVDNGESNSEGTRNAQSVSVDNSRTCNDRGRTTTRDPVLDSTESDRSAVSSRNSRRGANRDRDEDLAVPGPSGLSGMSRPSPSLQASHRYSNSSTIDPQFGVRLLSGHIENMQRICRAHLEITRHRHEIRRLEQIRSMLYDIQRQIHSLRASVDQSIEDLSGSLGDIASSPSQSLRPNEEDTTSPNTNTTGASPRSLCHRPRTAPRSVARLQRGPFGTRTRSRHSHSSWSMSPSVFRRIPRLRSVRTRYHLPGLCTPLRGAEGSTGEPNRERLPPRSVTDQLDHTPLTGAVIGPLPTPPPDERHGLRIVPPGDSNLTQTRTMLRHNFEQLQERLRERQEALEQQERRLRGFLGNSPSSSSSTTSSAVSSPSLDCDDDPPSPPERLRRSRPPTTSLSSRIANMLAHQAATANNVSGLETNTVQLCNVRRRLRQNILSARRDMLVGRTPGRAGGPILFPSSRLRSRNSNAERIHVLIREGLRREQRDHYRQILRHMADRLNSLVNQEQEQQQDEQTQQRQGEEPHSDDIPNTGHLSGGMYRHMSNKYASARAMTNPEQPSGDNSMDNHMENLRLLVRLALHLIDQLTNFICNQNISYEERPISRLPNPFRDEEMGTSGESSRSDMASSIDLDLSPGLHNLTTLFETVRMASEELRNDEGGGNESNSAQESTRPITNVPRRLTDFLRRSGNLAQQHNSNSGNEASGTRSPRANSSVPQLVIPRITLSDPSGSESQVEDDAAPSQPSRTSYNDRAEFSTRSVSGVPLRLLGRQYAVDRRSPDSEDNPGMQEVHPDALYHSPDPIPWRGQYDLGLLRGPGSEMLFRPNFQRVPPDRAAEREADNFFSRPYYASHPASRTMTALLQTHRIQAWDFTNYQIPDISDSLSNMVVGKCKIHNDASVDVSADGTLLAALVPESQAMIMVGVYSLENRSLGQLLYSYIFPPNTICVSLSPMARHLVVGFCSQMPRVNPHHNTKQVVAQIYKLCDNPMFHRQGQAGHLQLMREIEVVCDHRHTSLNCIRWLPYPGQGLIYGNNRGQLNILR